MAICLHFYIKYGNLLRSYSCSRMRNPYEVLGLKSTCSQRDVKKAYIKLCKELHPDMKPGDTSQHKRFIELNDAYTTLINSDSKRQTVNKGTYNDADFTWKYKRKTYASDNYWKSEKAWYERSASDNYWKSEKAWYERKEYQEYFYRRDKKHTQNENHRKANLWVVSGCFILIILGSILYAGAYRYALSYKKDRTDERSKKISETYDNVRKNAMEKGKTELLSNLQKRWNN